MDFEWDEAKNQQNIAKHGIDFENAKHIFDSRFSFVLMTERNYGENRLIATGVMKDILVVMMFTLREQRMRIVSVRKGNKHERKIYQDQIAPR